MRRAPKVLRTLLACLLGGLLPAVGLVAHGQEAPTGLSDERTYTFSAPDATIWLPAALREVSGLVLLNDTLAAAVQDELGVLYVLNPSSGGLQAELHFGPRGDYEDVAYLQEALYVLRSDGTLYHIPNWQQLPGEAFPLATALPAGCDAEGLVARPNTPLLLVACKEAPGPGLGSVKAVYAYDTAARRRLEAPAFTISVARFVAGLNDGVVNRMVRRVLDPFVDLSGFKPSGLAVHPITGQYYLLSSLRSAVVVLTPRGTVVEVHVLPRTLLPQPEALTFYPNGDLLIATEGGAGRARMHLFRYR